MKQPLPNLSPEEADHLLKRLDMDGLTAADKVLLRDLVKGYVSLKTDFNESRLTVKQLLALCGLAPPPKISPKDLAFLKEVNLDTLMQDESCTPDQLLALLTSSSCDHAEQQATHEETSNIKPSPSADAPNPPLANASSQESPEKKKRKGKGHGRNSHEKYPTAEEVFYKHALLNAGDSCPEGCGGKLYRMKDKIFIELAGNLPIKAIKHLTERLRCAKCLKLFCAHTKPGLRKCDPLLTAHLAIQKYGMGFPFYRQAALYRQLNIPLSDTSQYYHVKTNLHNPAKAIVAELQTLAANGFLFHYDDTHTKILDIMKRMKEEAAIQPLLLDQKSDGTDKDKEQQVLDTKKNRTGMFTTGILSLVEERRIVLFCAGTKHSGENMAALLENRTTQDAFITMSDAQSVNRLSLTTTPSSSQISSLCLAHARQKFEDLVRDFKDECTVALCLIRLVYQNDAFAKQSKMSADERLVYHQEHSKSPMTKLKMYLDYLITEKKVEPNSHMGRAVNYMRRHWEGFTRFLVVAGVPLDNNVLERFLKSFILMRKNSLFFKSEDGACVGGDILSLIVTCAENGVHVYDYFVAIQRYEADVLKQPRRWLPWCYQERLHELESLKSPSTAPPLSQVA